MKIDKNMFDDMDMDIKLEPGNLTPREDPHDTILSYYASHGLLGSTVSNKSTSDNIVKFPTEKTEFEKSLSEFNGGIEKFSSLLPQSEQTDWKMMANYFYRPVIFDRLPDLSSCTA